MPGSNYETWEGICDDLGRNILVFCWSCNYSEWSNYCQWLNHVQPTAQTSADYDAIFQHDNSPTHSQKCSVLIRGAWRCISTSTLTSTIARLKYHRTTVVSVSEKQITSSLISQATRCSSWIVVKYSIRDYSELTWVYSKKGRRCTTGKW
jgi:hypothetical protein